MNSFTLVTTKTRLKTYGDRAFVHCAPLLWNRLPLHIRSENDVCNFKRSLKTHLFKKAYNV